MDYSALKTELARTTPLTYAGLSDQAATDRLNALDTGRTLARRDVSKNELLTAIVDAEWPSTGILQHKLSTIFACDTIDASSANVKAIFAAIFGAATATRANLLALGTRMVSRAEELGLGTVTMVDVTRARTGVW